MINFSANNLYLLKSFQYDKAKVFYFKDNHTNRTYKLYDYQKSFVFDENIPYCVSGKINSANHKLYLIIETAKIDNKNLSTSPHTKK
jgi:hypothetical protein